MVVMVWPDVVMGPFGEEEGEGARAGESRKERGVKRGRGREMEGEERRREESAIIRSHSSCHTLSPCCQCHVRARHQPLGLH